MQDRVSDGEVRGWDVAVVCMLRMWGDITQFRAKYYFISGLSGWVESCAILEGCDRHKLCLLRWGGAVMGSACMVNEIR